MRCQLRLKFRWKGEEIIELELSTNELVDVTLGTNYTQNFDLNVDLDWVNDVAPPTTKLSDAKHHASLLFNFLLKNSSYFGGNEIISFQKLIGNFDKTRVANLGRQHLKFLNSYFKSSWEHLHAFGVISYYFIPSTLLKLVAYIFMLILLMFSYFLNINEKTTPR